MKPRLLDLFCGAGGASMGYHRAGFDVVGVDINPQPRYPFEFHQADAMTFDLSGFDAIHASPPCHDHSSLRGHTGRDHGTGWMLEATMARLDEAGVPWVVENVERATPAGAIILCGSMFGLGVRRHRKFWSSITLDRPACDHASQPEVIGVYGHPGGSSKRDGKKFTSADGWREAMGIDWMTAGQLAQAIPPAYTEHIGRQLIAHLGAGR